MRLNPVKPFLYTALLLLIAACFITACTKKDIKPNGNIITGSNPSKDSLAAIDSLPSFDSPTGVAVDAAGNIYVADYGNDLIRKINLAGLVSTLAGTGVQGQINATGILASFSRPTGIALDAAGNLYVADAGNNLIRKITQAGVVTTLAGGDTTGTVNGQGSTASFFDPLGVALDGSGNVYVADAGNNLIRMITPAGVVSTLAGNGNVVTDNGTLSANSFNNPTGVAADAAGNVYVANYLNNNILEVNPAGVVTNFAGDGQAGFADGAAASAEFYYPNNLAIDAAKNIYVSDGVNDLIRKMTPDGTVSTFAGSGEAGAVDSTGTAASFNGPAGLAVDAKGNVYVADSNNNLIRKITPAGVVSTIAGNGQPGAKNGLAVVHRNKKALKITAKNRFNIWKPGIRRLGVKSQEVKSQE
jgi:sugar lactone lactonase YvrE